MAALANKLAGGAGAAQPCICALLLGNGGSVISRFRELRLIIAAGLVRPALIRRLYDFYFCMIVGKLLESGERNVNWLDFDGFGKDFRA